MRALVVGAGVVGQVYGRHLARGGAEVAFLVKPEHAEEVRSGLTHYPLNRLRRRDGRPERFSGYRVHTRIADLAAESWDQVYLTMSSPALRAGGWFSSLAEVVGGATIVLLQPGPEDRAFVLREVPEERVVQGIITMIGYPAPLPGERRFQEPGIAYWFPPLTPSPLAGGTSRAGAVVRALNEGGLPARRVRDVARSTDYGAAFMLPLIAGLELAGWRLDRFRGPEYLGLAVRASREALEVIARRRRERPPLRFRLLARPVLLRPFLRLAPLATPFDLEAYLRVHFTKVGEQTRDVVQTYLDWGKAAGSETHALERVLPPGATGARA
jgi:ketopantoate reductase